MSESGKQQNRNKSTGSRAVQSENISRFSEYDIYLFKAGQHYRLYEKLGAHLMTHEGKKGCYFAVWAPNAEYVSVIGDFNGWNNAAHILKCRGDHSGIWEGFIPDVEKGTLYKYHIRSRHKAYRVDKSDPFAFRSEEPPKTASVVWNLNHEWRDEEWIAKQSKVDRYAAPMSVYELHLGSWKRVPEEGNRHLTYAEMKETLPAYVKNLGFTHVEIMPVMEHPFYGSWGYQVTGYFAPTSRFGTPQEFMELVDAFHEAGVGVILDWVPSHFPGDEHGLVYFDGTHLFEHADPRQGYHPDWKSYIFNYDRNEIRSFLLSNALFWLDQYHADGLRVDAVASMLYLDYSRQDGEWISNKHGGRENLGAISFLQELNTQVYGTHPHCFTVAEESTAWGGVSKPVESGGLGFGFKWMMGWMHDTLQYFAKDPIHRKYHQHDITFSMLYAFHENFILPLSHDEVVYGKQSLIYKMPGDEWQQFANLRLLYSYMYGHPGGKLLFMGAEFGQTSEWNHESSLDWHLLEYKFHKGMQALMKDLNKLYKKEKALHERSYEDEGFEWISMQDAEHSVMIFMRKGKKPADRVIVCCNFTPAVREHYTFGLDDEGEWEEILNSDDKKYGGSGVGNEKVLKTDKKNYHGRKAAMTVTLPPLAAVWFRYKGKAARTTARKKAKA